MSENPGGGTRSNVVGIICTMVEIGLTHLPKTGGNQIRVVALNVPELTQA